ncbi:MAG: hypothetical protein KDE48_01470 [Anaerolineales bacterium]|nr:hypothetical protein [Anaerolineales bacterium]
MIKRRNRLFVVILLVGVFLVSCSQSNQENEPAKTDQQEAVAANNPTATPPAVTAVSDQTTTEEDSSSDSEAAAEPTQLPTATMTVEPTATQMAPTEPPPTEFPTATAVPTETPIPPPTPTPTQLPSPTPLPEPDWLAYLNDFRASAGLARVGETSAWSYGSGLHSKYMVYTDEVKHSENKENEYFTVEGNESAGKGNLVAGYSTNSNYKWAIEYWLSAPFHGLPLLDPHLESVGFGEYAADTGQIKMGATLDVRGRSSEPTTSDVYPVFFPPADGQTWIVRHSMPEFPAPWGSCPDFPTDYFGAGAPTGPPIYLQLGSGELEPTVTAHSFSRGGVPLAHCVFSETSYVNADGYQQSSGRFILGERDAIILMPRQPLEVGQTYDVSITADGQTYAWSFEVISRPKTEE